MSRTGPPRTKKPKHFAIGPQATLANGKTWQELNAEATQAIARGIDPYWPRIVKALLLRYSELVRGSESLRQGELLAARQVQSKPPERNGV